MKCYKKQCNGEVIDGICEDCGCDDLMDADDLCEQIARHIRAKNHDVLQEMRDELSMTVEIKERKKKPKPPTFVDKKMLLKAQIMLKAGIDFRTVYTAFGTHHHCLNKYISPKGELTDRGHSIVSGLCTAQYRNTKVTIELIEKAQQLLQNGVKRGTVAKHFGVSTTMIKTYLTLDGKIKPEQEDKIKYMYAKQKGKDK